MSKSVLHTQLVLVNAALNLCGLKQLVNVVSKRESALNLLNVDIRAKSVLVSAIIINYYAL